MSEKKNQKRQRSAHLAMEGNKLVTNKNKKKNFSCKFKYLRSLIKYLDQILHCQFQASFKKIFKSLQPLKVSLI